MEQGCNQSWPNWAWWNHDLNCHHALQTKKLLKSAALLSPRFSQNESRPRELDSPRFFLFLRTKLNPLHYRCYCCRGCTRDAHDPPVQGKPSNRWPAGQRKDHWCRHGGICALRGSIAATNRTDKAIDERANMNASSANLKDFSCFTAQRFKTAHGLSLVATFALICPRRERTLAGTRFGTLVMQKRSTSLVDSGGACGNEWNLSKNKNIRYILVTLTTPPQTRYWCQWRYDEPVDCPRGAVGVSSRRRSETIRVPSRASSGKAWPLTWPAEMCDVSGSPLLPFRSSIWINYEGCLFFFSVPAGNRSESCVFVNFIKSSLVIVKRSPMVA